MPFDLVLRMGAIASKLSRERAGYLTQALRHYGRHLHMS